MNTAKIMASNALKKARLFGYTNNALLTSRPSPALFYQRCSCPASTATNSDVLYDRNIQKEFTSSPHQQAISRCISSSSALAFSASQEGVMDTTRTATDSPTNKKEQGEVNPYGLNNFQRMILQYNNNNDSSSKKNQTRGGKRNDGKRRRGRKDKMPKSTINKDSVHQEEKVPNKQIIDKMSNINEDDGHQSTKSDGMNNKRDTFVDLRNRSWRRGNRKRSSFADQTSKSQPFKKNETQHVRRNKPHPLHRLAATATSSDWILISGIPPMSKLSDVYQSLEQIIDFELQKGIIDLDALSVDRTNHDDVNMVYNALNGMGALPKMYTTQQIDHDGVIPLWVPPSIDSHNEDEGSMPSSPWILEARIYLSLRARPLGWFLRLPNRSVLHAVLKHVGEAYKSTKTQEKQTRTDEARLKKSRHKWREGLWMGVWNEFEESSREAAVEKESAFELPEGESHDQRELVLENGLEKEDRDDSFETASLDGDDSDVHQDVPPVIEEDEVNAYLRQYFELNPYPTQSSSSESANHEYQYLKCGSTNLYVREFTPVSSPSSDELPDDHMSNNDENASWEQHAFHVSPHLRLSDSVVRVETKDLRTNLHDIQFLFRGYDLESITPMDDKSAAESTFPSEFAEMPKSLGWNIHTNGNKTDGSSVDLLVEGTSRLDKTVQTIHVSGKKSEIVKSKRHTFMVRFASPAEARMAVRDKQGIMLKDQRLQVTQYPSTQLQ